MAYMVFKFGGTSVGDFKALKRLKTICSQFDNGLVIVVSAMAGVTDLLHLLGQRAAAGEQSHPISEIDCYRKLHLDTMDQMKLPSESYNTLLDRLEADCESIARIVDSIATIGEITPRTWAKLVSHGERFLSILLTNYLSSSNSRASYVDASELIHMAFSTNGLVPDFDKIHDLANQLVVPKLKHGLVVIPGFIASDSDGKLITLGRGGSDYSATIIGAALDASQVVLYKEVDGLMTADPRFVSEARVLEELHYREAAELAYFGAKVLHPRTIIPLVKKKIPLIIKNSFHSQLKGTRIAEDVGAGLSPVKALTAMSMQALVSIEGKGMMGVPGMASRAFSTLAQLQLSVSLISQSSSESSICFTLPEADAEKARLHLNDEFRYEIANDLIESIQVSPKKAIIAVVGLSMSGVHGVASGAFNCLKDLGVNVRAIAQGSSELNISIVIEESEVHKALNGLHRTYQLEKIKVYQTNKKSCSNITISGFGQIGQTLAGQILSQREYLKDKLGIEILVNALADSSGLVIEEGGFSYDQLQSFLANKKAGRKLCISPQKSDDNMVKPRFKSLWQCGFEVPIFVDATAQDSYQTIKAALENHFHIVLANKKPLSVDYSEYSSLMELAKSRGLHLRYEATVGAGLPILDTIDKLYESGDELIRISGCLSGTLGYIFSQIESGELFADAVKKAHRLGYTEPDPREDLSGVDVARKAVILARRMGLEYNLEQVQLKSVIDLSGTEDLSSRDFLKYIESFNDDILDKSHAARSGNRVLRYVARIEQTGISVGIESVESSSPLGRLAGSDNQVIMHSIRYDKNPLIVTGPGAGNHVTAAGVLNDIVAVTSSLS